MAQFVHLASEKDSAAIQRSGIKGRRIHFKEEPDVTRLVFAMPVTPNFFVSHQWLRELKRNGQRTLVGVYFRIPDDEVVLVGHYSDVHAAMTASEAVGMIFNMPESEGYEVIIRRSIEASEIHDVRSVPQVLGWRYYPESKGRKPCGCPVCVARGEINSRRLREAFERANGPE